MEQKVFASQDFGKLKQEIEELLKFTADKKLKNFLLKVQQRLDYCGHCNGPTYENGVCREHFVD